MAKRRQKHAKSPKRDPKTGRFVKKTAKREQSRVSARGKNGQGKAAQAHRVSGIKRIGADTNYWRRGTIRHPRYSTKLISSVKTGTTFRIKKKSAKIRAIKISDATGSKIAKKISNYTKIKDKPKQVYIKLKIKDSVTGETKWISRARQEARNDDDIEGILSALMLIAPEYSDDEIQVVGYEIEETVQ